MKKYFITVLMAVLAFASCSQRESYDPTTTVIEASFEQDASTTKLSISDDNSLTWSEGDAFMMFGEGSSAKFTLTGEAGKETATFSGTAPAGIKGAAFPWKEDARPNLSEGALTMTLSGELDQTTAGKCNLPMYSAISSAKSINFKHLAGVMRIRFSDIPSGYNTLTITASEPISGVFTANITDENPTLASTSNDSNDKVVTVTFAEATDDSNDKVLYIPLPVGTYEYIDVEISNGTETKELISYTNKTVERAKIYTASLTYVDVEASTPVAEGVTISSEGVYYISNVTGLKWFRDQVNGTNTFEGKTIKLVSDLDLNNEQWIPIGYWKTFNGTFDGQDHTISNLKHHGTEADCYIGLFGYTENATIKNLTINNVDIKLVANGSWAGGHIGALVGNIDGTTVIENIKVIGDVKIEGDMTQAGAGRIGGVVGGNVTNVSLKNVHVIANEGSYVKGNSSIGGIAGQLQGSIAFENCSANIEVSAFQFCAGGIIGLTAQNTTLAKCSSSGNVSVVAGRSGNANDLYRVGGIAGGWDDNLTSELVLTDCSYTGTLSGKSSDGAEAAEFDCGGFVGRGYSAVVGAVVKVNGTTYIYQGNGKYQVIPESVEINAAGSYVIKDVAGLEWLRNEVNGGNNFENKTIELAANIDLKGYNWVSIGTEESNFSGTFNGGSHTIGNLNIVETEAKEGKAYMGFFGYAKNAIIKNVTFENVNINIPCLDIDHSQGHIGAVAGSLEGTCIVENVTVKGDIKVEATLEANGASRVAVVAGGNSYGNVTMKNVHVVANEGSYLKANNNTGALAGQLQGVSVFENCSSNIDVTVYKFFAGGIIGIAAGNQTFTNCHTSGDIKVIAGRSGRANDHYRVGGIAGGWADNTSTPCILTDCSYTGEISGKNADGSIAEVLDYAGYVGRGYTLSNRKGSKVVIDGVEYIQASNNTYGIYEVDGNLEIGSLAALKWLASEVNSGNDFFTGKNVVLTSDIDLNNEEWTPVGTAVKDHGFCGNFDGNGKKIKNLKITAVTPDADGYVYAGFFGVTENNTIKNLIIENVNIDLDGHIVAAAIAYPYYTAVENVTVQGDIKIKGGDYTSGVLSYTRRCTDAKNITISGNSGSTITGNKTVGGVISDIQMNGGLKANYSNFKASGLTISAVMNVGGISGIIANQTLDGATVENVTIVCDDVRKGIVSGSLGETSTIKNISHKDVTGATNIVGATYKDGGEVVADGDVYQKAESND